MDSNALEVQVVDAITGQRLRRVERLMEDLRDDWPRDVPLDVGHRDRRIEDLLAARHDELLATEHVRSVGRCTPSVVLLRGQLLVLDVAHANAFGEYMEVVAHPVWRLMSVCFEGQTRKPPHRLVVNAWLPEIGGVTGAWVRRVAADLRKRRLPCVDLRLLGLVNELGVPVDSLRLLDFQTPTPKRAGALWVGVEPVPGLPVHYISSLLLVEKVVVEVDLATSHTLRQALKVWRNGEAVGEWRLPATPHTRA